MRSRKGQAREAFSSQKYISHVICNCTEMEEASNRSESLLHSYTTQSKILPGH